MNADSVKGCSKRCSPVPSQRLAHIRRVESRTRRLQPNPLTVPLEDVSWVCGVVKMSALGGYVELGVALESRSAVDAP